MNSKDIFSLALRILGLVFLYRGLSGLPIILPTFFGGIGNAIMCVLTVGWPLLVAWWLLRGAPLIMRLAYPDSDIDTQASQDIGSPTGKK